MTHTEGDIRADLDEDDRVVLILGGFPSGEAMVSIAPDQWNTLVKEVSRERVRRATSDSRFQREGKVAAEAAKAVQQNFDFYDG